jgi:hypothetical protein
MKVPVSRIDGATGGLDGKKSAALDRQIEIVARSLQASLR